LSGLLERTDEADARRRKALGIARTGRTESRKAFKNLFKLVESGDRSETDTTMVERMAYHRARIVTFVMPRSHL
jgi:hypothetical protein